MRILSHSLTYATGAVLFLQSVCKKGGYWHHLRARLLGILPLYPIFWNLLVAYREDRLLETETVLHVVCGTFYFHFWFLSVQRGTFGVKQNFLALGNRGFFVC